MKTRSLDSDVFSFIPVLEAAVLADNDVFFNPIEVPYVFSEAKSRVLQSVTVIDQDDQAVDFDLVFFNALVVLGTLNGAVSISDADVLASGIGGTSLLTASHTVDLIGNTLYCKTGIGLVLKKGASESLWVGGIVRSGTPDYTASGMKLLLGFV